MSTKDKPTPAFEKVAKWALGRHTGLSSKAIASRYIGTATESGYYDHPYDPSDFWRCYWLMCQVPEIDIAVMRGASPTWDKLVDAWPELLELQEKVDEKGRCAELYARMQQIRATPSPTSRPAAAAAK